MIKQLFETYLPNIRDNARWKREIEDLNESIMDLLPSNTPVYDNMPKGKGGTSDQTCNTVIRIDEARTEANKRKSVLEKMMRDNERDNVKVDFEIELVEDEELKYILDEHFRKGKFYRQIADYFLDNGKEIFEKAIERRVGRYFDKLEREEVIREERLKKSL